MAARFVLLYDSDCGLCTFFARAVGLADFRDRIEPIPLGASIADPWFSGATAGERFGSFHVVRPSGERVSRGLALIALAEALPLGAGFARWAMAMPSAVDLADRAYALMVRYRALLAGGPASP